MAANFNEIFKFASGSDRKPYGYQQRLACGEKGKRGEEEWLSSHSDCRSLLIDIPTGLGKTAAVIMAWIWNRVILQRPDWPRRLVYCLPMRTLVEQTEKNVEDWLKNLRDAALRKEIDLSESAFLDLLWLAGVRDLGKPQISNLPSELKDKLGRPHSPVVLMGGENPDNVKREWDLYPEKPCILIGTQDMLLSRALNRGYGMSRYRWPMHFALLNNDCLWVMDEVQLMGVGVETSAQLQGTRQHIGIARPCCTWWMSATLAGDRLKTPDLPTEELLANRLQLSTDEAVLASVSQRINARKEIRFTGLRLMSDKKDEVEDYIEALAKAVLATHENGALTLVILNRVNRAQDLFAALRKASPDARLGLIHSRFRLHDREKQMEVLQSHERGIVVATQAIEAGLDVSARHLFTEVAPWSSLVQRFGRCNRDGAQPNGGTIHWIDLASEDSKQQESLALPYTIEDIQRARLVLQKRVDASPANVGAVRVPEELVFRPVLRRKDVFDLFDTTADIAGQDLDISPYIRDGDDTDVEVFWRDIEEGVTPAPDTPKPTREETCRVSINALRSFIKSDKSNRIWRWQSLTNAWEVIQSPVPGMTLLVASEVGGYSSELGWTGNPKTKVSVFEAENTGKFEADGEDPETFHRKRETLTEHTEKVVAATQFLTQLLLQEQAHFEYLVTAALWHDVGKAHYHFQKMLAPEHIPPSDGSQYLAKSEGYGRPGRKHFRHELASALAWLDGPESSESPARDLIAYLIAAHHGKVRLSIRAMPTEQGPKGDPARQFARGVWDGETLPYDGWPPVHLCGADLPPLHLSLRILAMGRSESGGDPWLERTLRLRDRHDLGPFRLAYLETLLRCADGRASSSYEF